MSPDAEMVLLFGGLHLLGLALAAMLFVMFLRSDTNAGPPREDDGGGGGGRRGPEPRIPTGPRGGGLPLPDAVPARVRLREPARLADLIPAAPRRPAREPAHSPAPARRE